MIDKIVIPRSDEGLKTALEILGVDVRYNRGLIEYRNINDDLILNPKSFKGVIKRGDEWK